MGLDLDSVRSCRDDPVWLKSSYLLTLADEFCTILEVIIYSTLKGGQRGDFQQFEFERTRTRTRV